MVKNKIKIKDASEILQDTRDLQEIKERLTTESQQEFKLQDLEISELDRDNFCRCLASNIPYTEVINRPEFKIAIGFRDKTKKESDIISRCLDIKKRDDIIISYPEYVNSYNICCLYYQMESLNGVKQNVVYPESVWNMQGFDLLEEVEKRSVIGGFTSSMLYLALGLMTQFNTKLVKIAQEALTPNFTRPATDT